MASVEVGGARDAADEVGGTVKGLDTDELRSMSATAPAIRCTSSSASRWVLA